MDTDPKHSLMGWHNVLNMTLWRCWQVQPKRGNAWIKNTIYTQFYCTIFLCSLDLGNIVHGGDPLYTSVNHKVGCGGHSWPKWVRFFLQKTAAYMAGSRNSFFSDSKISFFWPRGYFFRPFGLFKIYRVFSKFTDFIRSVGEGYSSLVFSYLWIFTKFTESLLSNSVSLEGPLLEPTRSHQIKSTKEEAFRIYWVTQKILKNA